MKKVMKTLLRKSKDMGKSKKMLMMNLIVKQNQPVNPSQTCLPFLLRISQSKSWCSL